MPRKRRPVRMHATPVEPEPQNGSSTSWPGSVKRSTSSTISGTGFCVSWMRRSREKLASMACS